MGFLAAQQLHSRQVTSRAGRAEMAPDGIVIRHAQAHRYTYAYL
jgi:hypothetical protein